LLLPPYQQQQSVKIKNCNLTFSVSKSHNVLLLGTTTTLLLNVHIIQISNIRIWGKNANVLSPFEIWTMWLKLEIWFLCTLTQKLVWRSCSKFTKTSSELPSHKLTFGKIRAPFLKIKKWIRDIFLPFESTKGDSLLGHTIHILIFG